MRKWAERYTGIIRRGRNGYSREGLLKVPTERTEISRKNKYWIPKHRYLELKNFCLQYNEWVKDLENHSMDAIPSGISYDKMPGGSGTGDPTAQIAIARADYDSAPSKIQLINRTAYEADPALAKYIIWNVTEGVPYWKLRQAHQIPCSKNTFSNRRRKFFWILSKKRK